MKQYIDKTAVIAEIEKRMNKYATIDVGNSGELDALYGEMPCIEEYSYFYQHS